MKLAKIIGRLALAVLLSLAAAGSAQAQGDGPHSLPLMPKDMNIAVVLPLWLSGNFNPQQTVQLPANANVDVLALPLTYVRTFSLGGRFARLFMTAIPASLDASGTILDPRDGSEITISRGRDGWMDPAVTMHIGLLGTPALALPEFVKHPKGFQMVAIVGAAIPVGTYDSSRAINLGTNRWAFRLGVGTVTPVAKGTAWESANTVMLFTDNTDVFGTVDTRSQDPLFISENHFTYQFNPRTWASLDLRWQVGGETQSDGIDDDNRTDIIGGGISVGRQLTRQLSGYLSYGDVLASSGNADEWMVRAQLAYSF